MELTNSTKNTTKGVRNLGNMIKLERVRYGISQKDLADALGVSAKSVQNWEHEIASCSTRNLLAMSNIFKCSTDYLVGKSKVREIR